MRRLRDALEGRPRVTIGLGALLLAVHVGAGWSDWSSGRVDAWGVLYGSRTTEAMVLWGGRSGDAVRAGELWRLVSCGFLHAGPVHLVVNGMAMAGIGPLVEAVFGRARALLVFLVAVVSGAILSQLGGVPLAVGASGGVFGWLGALAAFGIARRARLHARLRPLFGRRLWPWVVVNLGLGFLVPGIDNLGHLGGLLAGAGLGLVLADELVDNARGTAAATTAVWAISGVLLAVGLGGLAFSLAGATTPP